MTATNRVLNSLRYRCLGDGGGQMTAAGCHWDGKGRAAAWAVRMVGRVSEE